MFEIKRQEAEKIYNIESVGEMHTYVYNANAEEVITHFENWWRLKNREYLHILVLASTKAQVQASNFAEIADRYGNSPEDWTPYQNEPNIKALLFEEYQTASKIPLIVGFVSIASFKDEEHEDDFCKHYLNNIIVITDGIALEDAQNDTFSLLYNTHQDKGNVIFALCESLVTPLKNNITAVFQAKLPKIYRRFYKNYKDDFSRYELEVPTKALLFRRLTNMARKNGLLQKIIIINNNEKNQDADLMLDASL